MLAEMHAHVIWGVDDGARDAEQMRRMLYTAASGGVKLLVCTSHMTPGRQFPMAEYRSRLEEAREWCATHAPDMQLETGAELLYTENTAELLAAGEAMPLAGTRLVLVEFMPDASEDLIRTAAEELGKDGWRMILAHAERYRTLHRGNALRRLHESGVLVQMNAQTVYERGTGLFVRRRTLAWLRAGLVDLVSSDAHDTVARPFCLQYARHELETLFGAEKAALLCGERFMQLLAEERANPCKK